jgi:hypothetical protein
MSAGVSRDPPLLQRLAANEAASPRSAGAKAQGTKVSNQGLFGMLSRFMFTPAARTDGLESSPSSSSTKAPTSLPKADSQGSFTSEYFGEAEFDFAEVSSDSENEQPSTPPPPSMRRNGGSFGSFGSLTDGKV